MQQDAQCCPSALCTSSFISPLPPFAMVTSHLRVWGLQSQALSPLSDCLLVRLSHHQLLPCRHLFLPAFCPLLSPSSLPSAGHKSPSLQLSFGPRSLVTRDGQTRRTTYGWAVLGPVAGAGSHFHPLHHVQQGTGTHSPGRFLTVILNCAQHGSLPLVQKIQEITSKS